MNKQVKVIGYCRVANRTQIEANASVQEQEDEIAEAAEILNFSIAAMFIDNWASLGEHEFLNEAFRYCQKHEDVRHLLITEPNRISRNVRVFNIWLNRFKDISVEVKCLRVKDNDRTQHLACMSALVEDICYRASITNAEELDTPTQDLLEEITQLLAKLHTNYLSGRVKQGLMAKTYKGIRD